MEWLNYHHLLYFWVVAKTGSIAKARTELRLTQPTISAQIQRLEESLGAPLFVREGRGLVLTDTGRIVYKYAEEIFNAGREMVEVVKGETAGRAAKFSIGIADVIPKLVAHRVIESVLSLPQKPTLICRQDSTEKLLAELSIHGVDLVLSDAPIPPGVHVRAYNHLLGECGVVFCAAPQLAADLPMKRNLSGAALARQLARLPFLLPAEGTAMRRSIEQWFQEAEVTVSVAGEFDDSALLKVFGAAGAGFFSVPEVIEKEVCTQYGVRVVARVPEIRERFYIITPERRVKHPAAATIIAAAKTHLFK